MHAEEVYTLLAVCGLHDKLRNQQVLVHVGRYFEPHAYFSQCVRLWTTFLGGGSEGGVA